MMIRIRRIRWWDNTRTQQYTVCCVRTRDRDWDPSPARLLTPAGGSASYPVPTGFACRHELEEKQPLLLRAGTLSQGLLVEAAARRDLDVSKGTEGLRSVCQASWEPQRRQRQRSRGRRVGDATRIPASSGPPYQTCCPCTCNLSVT